MKKPLVAFACAVGIVLLMLTPSKASACAYAAPVYSYGGCCPSYYCGSYYPRYRYGYYPGYSYAYPRYGYVYPGYAYPRRYARRHWRRW